jgi:hypothetical protein
MTVKQWNRLGFQVYGPDGGRPVRGRKPRPKAKPAPATDGQGLALVGLRLERWRRDV